MTKENPSPRRRLGLTMGLVAIAILAGLIGLTKEPWYFADSATRLHGALNSYSAPSSLGREHSALIWVAFFVCATLAVQNAASSLRSTRSLGIGRFLALSDIIMAICVTAAVAVKISAVVVLQPRRAVGFSTEHISFGPGGFLVISAVIIFGLVGLLTLVTHTIPVKSASV